MELITYITYLIKIVEINGISYNIWWEGQYPIIDNNGGRMDTLPSVGELTKLAITI